MKWRLEVEQLVEAEPGLEFICLVPKYVCFTQHRVPSHRLQQMPRIF